MYKIGNPDPLSPTNSFLLMKLHSIIIDNLGISSLVFTSRTNLKLHNVSVTPKMVKKIRTNLDSLKASGPDCIPVVVLKNCDPELSY